ncbi:MAS20 protein import receptor containing protein [Aphelenchoides avenae]|nr:MAS20 protein import receptor containing protein [Aphelenchus avenae]
MAELSEELGRKRAAVDSLEKAVQDTEYEIHLLKNRQMEKDRQIAEMSKRIRELEELQAADKRDAALEIAELETFVGEERSNVEALEELVGAQEEELAALSQKVKELEELQAAGNREIGELETIIEEERANVKALEELVEAKDQELTGLPQTSQHLMTLEEKNIDEKHGEQAGHARALKCAEVSAKSKPALPSPSMGEEKKTIQSEIRTFFMQEVQLGKELMAEEMYEEGVEHLSNAVVMCAQPGHALHFFQQILPSEQFELLLRALPAAKQRIGLKYPELLPTFEAAVQDDAAGEGGAHAALAGDEKKKNKKSMKRARTEHRNKIAPSVCGLTVSLLASNGHYLCGNYGAGPVTVTGSIGANENSVRFTLENARNGKVALKSCWKYLCITEDGSAVTCGRRRNKLSHFDWIKHRSGEVSLRGANGKYASSEGAFVTCNRDEVGPLERFTVV